jgi:hypothetical protein
MKYYKTDSRKISFIEYWNITSTLKGFLLASRNKILGKQMNLTRGIPELVPFPERIVATNAIPPLILANLDSGIAELKQLGFDQFWYYMSKESLTAGVGYGVQAVHSSRQAIGKIVFVAVRKRKHFSFSFISQLKDETFYFTTNNRKRFNSAPGHFGLRKLGTTSRQLWEIHQKSLERLSRRGNPVKVLADFNQMVESDNVYMKQMYEDKIRRGIWVEMTEAEVATLRAQPPLQPSV